MNNKIPLAAVVLAAGKSSRMGQLKQLLPINGAAMLETMITKLLSFPFRQIISVVGYKAVEIKAAIAVDDPRFAWVTNLNFHDGMSTSVKEALNQIMPDTQGIIIFLGDQPQIKKSTIEQLIVQINEPSLASSKCIIQASYQGKPGHPVYISSDMFPYLNELTGDQGAKPIFKFAENHILLPVDDPGVTMDIDTPSEYLKAIEWLGNPSNENS
jgi:molybdenum cofactor cytidylyltransferase